MMVISALIERKRGAVVREIRGPWTNIRFA